MNMVVVHHLYWVTYLLLLHEIRKMGERASVPWCFRGSVILYRVSS